MTVSPIFPTEEIDQQTTRILNFPMFRKSPVLSRFLEFVIAETVHNREMQIKEYSIAINVLHRAHNFNPNVDSIVRIHAGRLRRALNDYYLTQGIYDRIIIQIPKGCYVPEFLESGITKTTQDEYPASVSSTPKTLVAIFPFRGATKREDINEALGVLKDQLSEELLSFPNISVIGYYSDKMQAKIKENVLEAGRAAGAGFIISGSFICMGDYIRLIMNLSVTETGEVLLCKSFRKISLSGNIFEINDAILQNLAAFSGECYGMILQEWQKHVA